jgi:hypothetical protein
VVTVRDIVKADLESNLADLLRIRETDPYRQLAHLGLARCDHAETTGLGLAGCGSCNGVEAAQP